MRYAYAQVICPLLILTGCARTTAPGSPIPETSRPSEPVSAVGDQSWAFKPDATPHSYTSVNNVTLVLAGNSGSNRDSMVVTSRYSLSLDRTDESISVSGQIDQYSIVAGSRITPVSPAKIPVQFIGAVTNGQIMIQPAGSLPQSTNTTGNCPDLSLTIISGIRRSILALPSRISVGMIWHDSTTSTICHGSTPVVLTSIHTYRVGGAMNRNGRPVVLIERIGKSLSTGNGSDGQHRVAITGEGVTTDKLYVDTESGLLIEAEQSQEMRLTVTSSGRNQRFTQTTHELVTLTNQ